MGDISRLSDEEFLDLIAEVQAEIKYRIGRCDLCGERHSAFNLCPDTSRLKYRIEQESDFEIAARKRTEAKRATGHPTP